MLAQTAGYSASSYFIAYFLLFFIGGALVLWMRKSGVTAGKIFLTCFLLFMCPVASIVMAIVYTQQTKAQ